MKTTSCPYCDQAHAARSPGECPTVLSVQPQTRLGRRVVVVTYRPESGLPEREFPAPPGKVTATLHR